MNTLGTSKYEPIGLTDRTIHLAMKILLRDNMVYVKNTVSIKKATYELMSAVKVLGIESYNIYLSDDPSGRFNVALITLFNPRRMIDTEEFLRKQRIKHFVFGINFEDYP